MKETKYPPLNHAPTWIYPLNNQMCYKMENYIYNDSYDKKVNFTPPKSNKNKNGPNQKNKRNL